MSTKMNWSYTNSLKLEQRRPRDGEHGALFYVVESIFLLLRNSRNTKLLVRIYSFLLKWVQSSRVTHSSGVFTKWPSLAIPSVHGIRGPRERKPYQAVSTKVGEGQKVLFQRASPSAQVQFRWAVSKLFTNITFKMAEWKQGLFGCCGNCGNCEYFGPFFKKSSWTDIFYGKLLQVVAWVFASLVRSTGMLRLWTRVDVFAASFPAFFLASPLFSYVEKPAKNMASR